MMLLAMISWTSMLVLIIGGCIVSKVFKSGARSAPGFILKTLGVVAVVAGIGVLATRSNRSDIEDSIVNVDLGEHGLGDHGIDFPEGFDRGDFLKGDLFDHDGLRDHGRVNVVPSGLIIVLGSGLIILGAMLFGRERTRPFALKALSFLGVGAILFSVASYFGEPPRAEPTVRMVHAERQYGDDHHPVVRDEHRVAKRPTRATRAKRPSLRPDRPSSASSTREESIEDFLPPRAGEIPVAAELAKTATQPDEAKPTAHPEPVTDVKVEVAEVKVAEVKIAEPKVEEAAAEEPKPAEAAPAAPEATEAPAVVEAPAAEEPKPAEPAAPAVAAAEPPKPAAEATPAPAPAPATPSDPEPAPVPQPSPATHETAVAAAPKIISSEPRPAWVDRAPGLSDGVYAVVVSSGPYVSIPECQRALNDEILAATNHYINEYLGDDHAAALVNLPVSFTRQNIKKTEYAEVVESPSVGRMHQLHARLEFDDHTRNMFQQRWRNAVVQDRLWYTGGGAALVLALLATFYGYLKLDLKTDAPHKGRLQLAATLVALIVAAGALLARWAVQF